MSFVLKGKTNKGKSIKILPPLLLTPPYTVQYAPGCMVHFLVFQFFTIMQLSHGFL